MTPDSALVVGFARTGRAVAAALVSRGARVVAIDDAPDATARPAASAMGIELIDQPAQDELARLVADAEQVVVSPGVPPRHPVFRLARPGQVVAEIELAFELGAPPILAVTGTNGKTTVTELVAAMLLRSGRRAVAAGNIGVPLVEAIGDEGAEMIVAEVSSFQLEYTTTFAPAVATHLNLAEDHLDWHDSYDDYAAAKAKIFAHQSAADVAIANADDPATLAAASASAATLVTFGAAAGDYHEAAGALVGPAGETLALVEDLPRRLPHDKMNALAALATARAGGAEERACRQALRNWTPPPHRVERVAEVAGIAYYDDSKATTPSAVIAALAGFESVVLIAGGKNKGLDLTAIPRAVAARRAPRLRAVVAIGEATDEVIAAFSGERVVRAGSMDEAVATARALAETGDAVLLSPGCASFDWYPSYAARGEDFVAAVRRLAETRAAR